MQSDIRSQIEEFLAKDQIDKALELFVSIPSLRQEGILLSRRWNAIKEGRRKQTSTDERASVEMTKLSSAILEYLDECDELPLARREATGRKDSSSLRGEGRPEFDSYAEKEPARPIKQRWALLVGVNRYVDPTFPSLRFCLNDVLALEQQLKELGYTVLTLHDEATEDHLLPTRDNVEAELSRLCQAAGEDDLLFAHFACHGKLVSEQPFLILRDSRRELLAKRGLALAEIETLMKGNKARRLVLSLDACHVGVELGRDVSDPEFIRNVYESAEGFALLAAGTAEQVAQEWRDRQHGVFSYFLLEALSGKADCNGKGFVTVDDTKNYVLDGLRKWNVEHGGLLQEPSARSEGLGDMILADYRNATTD